MNYEAPTSERIKRATTPIIGPAVDRQTSRPYHRVIGLWELMEAEGQLTRAECAAMEILTKFVLASEQGIWKGPAYGQSSSSGTPIGQQAESEIVRLDPTERRIHAWQKLEAARVAVDDNFTMSRIEFAIVSGHGKSELGAAFGWRDRRQQAAAAVTAVQQVARKLAAHYKTAKSRERI